MELWLPSCDREEKAKRLAERTLAPGQTPEGPSGLATVGGFLMDIRRLRQGSWTG